MQNSDEFIKNDIDIYNIIKLFLNDAYQELMKIQYGNVKLILNEDMNNFKFSLQSSSRVDQKETGSKEYNDLRNIIIKNPHIKDLYKVKDSGFFFQGIVLNKD